MNFVNVYDCYCNWCVVVTIVIAIMSYRYYCGDSYNPTYCMKSQINVIVANAFSIAIMICNDL